MRNRLGFATARGLRTLLAATLVISSIASANAACTTARLAGPWLFSSVTVTDSLVCKFPINASGRSVGTCILYPYGAEPVSGQLGAAFKVTSTCFAYGRLFNPSNPSDFVSLRGRTDAQFNILVGTVEYAVSFTTTRDTAAPLPLSAQSASISAQSATTGGGATPLSPHRLFVH